MMTTTQQTNDLADALLYLGECNREGAIEALSKVLRSLQRGEIMPNAGEAIDLGLG